MVLNSYIESNVQKWNSVSFLTYDSQKQKMENFILSNMIELFKTNRMSYFPRYSRMIFLIERACSVNFGRIFISSILSFLKLAVSNLVQTLVNHPYVFFIFTQGTHWNVKNRWVRSGPWPQMSYKFWAWKLLKFQFTNLFYTVSR